MMRCLRAYGYTFRIFADFFIVPVFSRARSCNQKSHRQLDCNNLFSLVSWKSCHFCLHFLLKVTKEPKSKSIFQYFSSLFFRIEFQIEGVASYWFTEKNGLFLWVSAESREYGLWSLSGTFKAETNNEQKIACIREISVQGYYRTTYHQTCNGCWRNAH